MKSDEISYLEWKSNNFLISTDKNLIDVEALHAFLTTSTWAKGIDIDTVSKSVHNSLCFGLYSNSSMIGFARLITDYATFGYLCDVYILEPYRKRNLATWLIQCCHEHPELSKLRRIMLVTSTAPWLYEKTGYHPVNRENFVWQVLRDDIYNPRN